MLPLPRLLTSVPFSFIFHSWVQHFLGAKLGFVLKGLSVAGGQQSVGESASAPGQLFLGSVSEPLPLTELQFLP